MKEKLYLYHRENRVKTLGPGIRYVIWTQGCIHNCPGCIAEESHSIDSGGYWIEVEEIIEEIRTNKKNGIKGVTISGGEPFLQGKALLSLVKKIEELGLDIICYSGYTYEKLLNNVQEYAKDILEHIDILIDGKFEKDKNTGSYLRGSDNQRIIHLKNTYKVYEEKMLNSKSRNVEVKILENNMIFLAGVPPVTIDQDWKIIRKKIYRED